MGNYRENADGSTTPKVVPQIGEFEVSAAHPMPVSVSGGGDASAANQATEIAALASIDGHVDGLETLVAAVSATLGDTSGAAVTTDANGTIQQYLRGLIKQWIAGTLKLASVAYTAVVSLTRTADTNAYAANDVIGAATGSTAALTFPIGAGAGEVMITSAALETDAAAVISGEAGYRLHLYNVTPPSALGDNVAWDLPSGDRALYLGFIDLGQPVDLGSTCYVEVNGINKQITLAGANAFGYLVTLGAFTPASATVRKITLHSVAL